MAGGARTGALVAGAAGAVLLLSIFLTWFHVESASFDIREASGVEGYSFEGLQTEYTYTGPYLDTLADEQDKERDASAWDAFTGVGRFLILFAALAGLGLGGAALAGISVPRGAKVLVLALAVVTLLFVLFRIVSPPDILGPVGGLVPEGVDLDVDAGRRFGLWLGLLATIGVAVGTYLSLSAESVRPRSRRRSESGSPRPAENDRE